MTQAETNNGFRNNFFFLSNFSNSPVKIHFPKLGTDILFPTVEHAFQAAKAEYNNLSIEEATVWAVNIASAPTPNKAKYFGRSIPLNRNEWDKASLDRMRVILFEKFEQNPNLKQKLVDTGNLVLVEYNSWNDTLWGVNSQTRQGKNQLGILLMELREQFKDSSNVLW